MSDPTSLPGEINAATRSLHTTLNRLITTRLPLALPPHTSDPSLYTTGLLHFAHIYLTFESLWNDLVSAPTSPPTSPLLSFLLVNPYDAPEMFSSPPSPQMVRFLRTLRPKGLTRSARLKADLEFLTGLHPTDLSVLLAQYPGDKVADYCQHIRRNVKVKPHVLVAYAWCFYMAVFSGGRYIRSELVKSGDEFWRTNTGPDTSTSTSSQLPLSESGLSFWSFLGPHDGEDIKADFKQRLLAAESFFTPDERIDVIEEAKSIFKFSAGLVQELDEKLATDLEKLNVPERVERPQPETARGEKGAHVRPTVVLSRKAVMWWRRPEVTGAAVALGCLAGVALLRMEF
ncbi:hypothetical protein BDV95DRAFT_612604 [Massariosphaeria phaeospora]|uniref:Heme oxygenase-like protein n=1 Tax=Massariosphaeria phaeospora TaxID=100035 RepID=A0A7C8M730_9PLEO|nr:hypothetical protein BDV95DRAFT_612604 [Massariosphaeria phaeospora]